MTVTKIDKNRISAEELSLALSQTSVINESMTHVIVAGAWPHLGQVLEDMGE